MCIGLTFFVGEGRTAAQLLANADLAMYEAKNGGRDRARAYVLGDEREKGALDAWSERVRSAIDDDALVLFGQPIVDLRTGRPFQYELLLRMKDEKGELVPPSGFLSTAERFGAAPAFDAWVLRQAIGLLRAREPAHPVLSLAINLSGKSIADPDFLALVEHELASASADHVKLAFEVTETIAIADMERTRKFASALHRLGCTLGLDDFGAGFGSFHYLRNVPVDYVKMDGEFISHLAESRSDQLLVQAMVEVARGLDKKTIAKWVGEPKAVALLREYGVDYAQGYHLGKPRPIAEVFEPRRRDDLKSAVHQLATASR
jgi:EAL domain-containing protein (putative c-di-GMP-specific phosphodiesterase class I)